jgi:RNA polymerase sigma factor (sigma-70 family)
MMQEFGSTDRQLLDSFVLARDSSAFRDLVARHGPSVLQVCRGVLQDSHAADDAFQATFLVLVRKARSIQQPEKLGPWLRGVAYRTSLRARGRAARRRAVEIGSARHSWIEPIPDESSDEIRRVITDELERLPDTYRQPVTLCYLQGLTHLDAAQRLGWPIGTVKVRLVRARRLLQERLRRRGVVWHAGLLLSLLRPRGAQVLPEPLVESTVRALKLARAGRSVALEAHFGRAFALAELALTNGIRRKAPWIWAVSTVAMVLLMLTTGPAILALGAPPAPEVSAASLPSNLTDILTVECR